MDTFKKLLPSIIASGVMASTAFADTVRAAMVQYPTASSILWAVGVILANFFPAPSWSKKPLVGGDAEQA